MLKNVSYQHDVRATSVLTVWQWQTRTCSLSAWAAVYTHTLDSSSLSSDYNSQTPSPPALLIMNCNLTYAKYFFKFQNISRKQRHMKIDIIKHMYLSPVPNFSIFFCCILKKNQGSKATIVKSVSLLDWIPFSCSSYRGNH